MLLQCEDTLQQKPSKLMNILRCAASLVIQGTTLSSNRVIIRTNCEVDTMSGVWFKWVVTLIHRSACHNMLYWRARPRPCTNLSTTSHGTWRGIRNDNNAALTACIRLCMMLKSSQTGVDENRRGGGGKWMSLDARCLKTVPWTGRHP
jgi:hypothetical protein